MQRALTTDTALAALLPGTLNLCPPQLFSLAAATLPTPARTLTVSLDTSHLVKEAKRQAMHSLIDAAPRTPTEEELEELEAHEAVLSAEVDKARRRLSIKHKDHEEMKLRAAHGRKRLQERAAKAKDARKELLMAAKRAELKRQQSEQ